MLTKGHREPRWATSVICLALSGNALAEGVADGASAGVLLASIAPLPMEVVSPIPEPGQYVFRYALQYSSYQEATAGLSPSDFYAASPETFGRAAVPSSSGSSHLQQQPQATSVESGFGTVASSASLLSLLQLSDEGTGSAAHTTRRLAMMVNDWRVSASAHLSVTHGHDTGAAVSLQHKF
ncbi:hypothetical protein WJ542_30485 [Paraburkholderia sp. B3]|uniref:hypothetical protein n=1 Tax=Paraburkholderia sp. B3 TaxID=3134791 RepID=UPI003982A3D8